MIGAVPDPAQVQFEEPRPLRLSRCSSVLLLPMQLGTGPEFGAAVGSIFYIPAVSNMCQLAFRSALRGSTPLLSMDLWSRPAPRRLWHRRRANERCAPASASRSARADFPALPTPLKSRRHTLLHRPTAA